MSYEVLVRYYPKGPDGFDHDEPGETKTKIGKKWDDDVVDDQVLANFLLTQLARRDVYVYDFEVFEFVRKKVEVSVKGTTVRVKNNTFRAGLEKSFDAVETVDDEKPGTRHERPKQTAEHAPIDKADSYVERLIRGEAIVPIGDNVPFPLGQVDEVSCDSPSLCRSLVYSPIRAPQKGLEPGTAYPVVCRVRKRQSDNVEETIVIVRGPNGSIVREKELDFTPPPKKREDYSAVTVVDSQQSGASAAEISAPVDLGGVPAMPVL